MVPYEVIGHTADIGIRACGQSREELFMNMARGMVGLIVPSEKIRLRSCRKVLARASDWEGLLVAWLREVLVLFDTRRFLAGDFRIHRLEPTHLAATLRGETLDEKRHPLGREVKAVTYCDLSITQRPDGIWTAQVIFDV